MFQLSFVALALTAGLSGSPAPHAGHQAEQTTTKILIDQPLRMVEYQLGRLSNDELARVERKPDDAKYKPVYVALLTRKGLAPTVRTDALAVLTKMTGTDDASVLVDALAKVKPEDESVAEQLVSMLAALPADQLRSRRAALVKATEGDAPAFVLRGAYAGMMVADGSPAQAWTAAAARDGHLTELLRSVPSLTKADAVRSALFTPIAELVAKAGDPVVRAEALAALGYTRRDSVSFDLLSKEVVSGTDAASRGAAIRSLSLFPEASWSKGSLEDLARALVSFVKATETNKRTESPAIDAVNLGERIAAVLPAESGRAVRRDLRALGVQVVRIGAIVEQVRFDLNWFAVEAGKAVQIVLVNPDAMPHNLVVGQPGSLQDLGTTGGNMPMPTDPAVKPFVPNSPQVLFATRLVQQGETERLAFVAPKEPGEYVFLCSFPGHWLRMYGVMLVVPSLDAWEAKPSPPTDPMTKQPFASQRN